jgi:hypothetical protein
MEISVNLGLGLVLQVITKIHSKMAPLTITSRLQIVAQPKPGVTPGGTLAILALQAQKRSPMLFVLQRRAATLTQVRVVKQILSSASL